MEDEQLKTAVGLATNTRQAIGAAGVGSASEGVPPDHLRYIYWIKYNSIAGSTAILTAYENRGGTLKRMDQQLLTQYQTVQLPLGGPGKKPIMVIQGSSTVDFQTSGSDTSGQAFVTYAFIDKPGGG